MNVRATTHTRTLHGAAVATPGGRSSLPVGGGTFFDAAETRAITAEARAVLTAFHAHDDGPVRAACEIVLDHSQNPTTRTRATRVLAYLDARG